MTVTCDFWTDRAKRPLLGVVLCGPKGSAFEMCVDTSGLSHTADSVSQALLSVIESRDPKLTVQVSMILTFYNRHPTPPHVVYHRWSLTMPLT